MSWPSLSLDTIVTIKGGGTPSKKIEEYWNGDIPWVSVKDFKSTFICDSQDKITKAGVENSATNLIPSGSIIIPTRMALGKVGITTAEVAINQDLKALLIKDSSKVDLLYLARFLESKAEDIIKQGKGATVKGITLDVLKNIKIPLPPLPVQKQIAAVLEKADTLRSQCQQMEQELNSLAQSVFLYIVGDKSSEFLNWPQYPIESLCSTEKGSMRTGPFGSDLKHSEFVKSGYPVIGIDNAVDNEFKWKERRYITEEKFQKLKRYTVKPKDIIITIMGTVGRVAVIPENIPTSISTKHLAVLTINDEIALPEFVADAFRYSILVNRQISKKNKGAIMDGLNLGLIKSLNLRLPPLELQNEYLRRKNKLISSLSLCRSEGSELTDGFNSLMQRAFKGELELKDVA